MIRNIIFDWSGTLVDDLPAVWQATNYIFRKAGLPEMTLDRFRAEFCLPFRRFYDRYTPNVPLAQLEEWFHGYFRQAQESVIALPHARAFLEFCRARRLHTFVLSSVHREHYAAQAQRTGFAEFIECPYVEVHDKSQKIRELLAENRLHPDETLFIGDMQHDIETARHGGIHSCAVLTGYNHLEQLRASEPDLIVEHLGELRERLERTGLELHEPVDRPPVRQPVVTVGALIYDREGRVLMVRTRKWSDLWGIPGGKVRYGETCEAALRRELKEETNLHVEDIRFVVVQDCIHSREFYRAAHFVLLNYTCRSTGAAEVKLNEESVDFRWASPREALQMPLNQPTRILLDAVLAPNPSSPK